MNEMRIFNYGTNNVRTVQKDDEPWFVLKDVCSILGMDVSKLKQVTDRLEDDEKARYSVPTIKGNQEMWIINESGLYSVILRSDKSEAKQFRKWVTSEVIPSIRKHGAYMTEVTIDNIINNPEFGIQLLTTLKQEQDKRKALELENAQQKQMLLEAKPKLDYVDQILSTKSAINITQIAKDYGIGGVTLNKKLHELGIQYKQNGQWLLYEKYAKRGYTKSRTVYYEDYCGEIRSVIHTMWTQKGRMFLYEKLKANGMLPLIEQE